MSPPPGIAAGLLVVTVVAAATALLPALLTGRIIDLLNPPDVRGLVVTLACLLTLTVVDGTIQIGEAYFGARLREDGISRARGAVFAHVQGAPYEAFTGTASSEISTRMLADLDVVSSFVQMSLLPTASAVLRMLFAIAVMCVASVPLCAAAVLSASLVALPLGRVGARIKALRTASAGVRETLDGAVQDAVSTGGVALIKTFGRALYETRSVAALADKLARLNVRTVTEAQAVQMVSGVVSALGPTVVIALGIVLIVHHQLTTGQLVAFLGLQAIVYEPISRLATVHLQYSAAAVMIDRILSVFELPQEHGGRAVPASTALEFRDVTLTFGEDRRPVLDHVSFVVHPGETIALVGRSGSGKSTIANLLLRLHTSFGGSITIGGVPIGEMPLSRLRAMVTVCPQEPFLHNRSIRENVAYAREEAGDDELLDAVRKAQALPFVIARGGLVAGVGMRGSRLSGGERQRLALARAMVHGAQIVVLDEALSGVDSALEAHAIAALREAMPAHAILIVVTHRLSSLTAYARVLVLEDGRIVEDGSFADLRASRGVLDAMAAAGSEVRTLEEVGR